MCRLSDTQQSLRLGVSMASLQDMVPLCMLVFVYTVYTGMYCAITLYKQLAAAATVTAVYQMLSLAGI